MEQEDKQDKELTASFIKRLDKIQIGKISDMNKICKLMGLILHLKENEQISEQERKSAFVLIGRVMQKI
ncbi:MAG: hypothetical protein KAI02_03525 [Gammaproteobacteria bacterium]|nr:hypothetical protein [Gammaproteobacteria bacterium]